MSTTILEVGSGDQAAIEVIQQESVIVESGGSQGPPGTSAQILNIETATASSVTVAESLAAASCQGAKWFVFLEDTAGDRQRSMEIFGVKKSDGMRYTIYGRTGDSIDAPVSIRLLAGNIEVVVTNNEVVDLLVRVLTVPVCILP